MGINIKAAAKQRTANFDCQNCRAYSNCLSSSLAKHHANVFQEMLSNQFIIERGDILFSQNQPSFSSNGTNHLITYFSH